MKNPPIMISVIGFFAILTGIGYVVLGLRLLGFDLFGALGDLPAFEPAGLWGVLTLTAAVFWIVAAVGLWALEPWAWVTAMVVAGVNLFEAFLWFLESPGSGVGFAMALMPLVIILYLNTGTVKEAFGLEERAAVR